MKKIPTLFVRDEQDRKYVTSEVNPGCEWVINGEGRATRKFDGTCVKYDGERWWARREVKPGKKPPAGYVLEDHDQFTDKIVGWEPVEQSSFGKFLDEAVDDYGHGLHLPGTYELCGPKVNGNPEGYDKHVLIPHGQEEMTALPRDYEGLREWLADCEFEGVVWHHPDGRMVKLKRRDLRG